MTTEDIWNRYSDSIYFFILKRVKDKSSANDVFQNAFLKIHNHLHQVKEPEKVRSWVFQIVRNEISNYFKQSSQYITELNQVRDEEKYQEICCFDRFINELPDTYKEAIELVYVDGKKQEEASKILDISLANLKARVRRGKDILKKNFNSCCKYQFDSHGKLTGESDCNYCHDVSR